MPFTQEQLLEVEQLVAEHELQAAPPETPARLVRRKVAVLVVAVGVGWVPLFLTFQDFV